MRYQLFGIATGHFKWNGRLCKLRNRIDFFTPYRLLRTNGNVAFAVLKALSIFPNRGLQNRFRSMVRGQNTGLFLLVDYTRVS